MLNNLLSKFGSASGAVIGVALSPSVGLEMIEIDKNTKTVSKYACRPLEYNYSTREISDYDEFRTTLAALFEDLKIPKNSDIILTVPNVYFGLINLPLMFGDEAVSNAILSEVEQTYIFKRQEPVVGWTNIVKPNQNSDSTDILYSAIQNNALAEIYASCMEVGCHIIGIETSYLSLLKALYYTNTAEEQMQDFVTWNLMIIGQNNYSIISLSGKNVISYYEEPLALKSFSGEEIYNAIISSSTLTLTTNPANWLYIVSETDLVSAEVLSKKISFDGQITYLESNKYVQKPLMEASKSIMPNLVLKMTPEIIGSGIYTFVDYPIKLNLIGEFKSDDVKVENFPVVNVGNLSIELSPSFIKKMSIFITVPILLIILLIFVILNVLNNKQIAENTALGAELAAKQAEMKQYDAIKVDTFDEKTEMSLINAYNKEKLIYYSALGLSIPAKTWITQFKITKMGKVYISGKTSRLEDVYNFYRDLKLSVINSDLKVYTLEAIENDDSESTKKPKFYSFEITNMEDVDIVAMKEYKNYKGDQRSQNPEQALNEQDIPAAPAAPADGSAPPADGNNAAAPPPQAPAGDNNENPFSKGLPPNLEKIESF
ncbi:hypothetical protein IJ818_07470 [bacterium]|nr:hypothetical protein [bacterium]